ncbi:MAG: peptidoglycan D,D-transpeptidase FtsI family protein [Alphaproteobacteria bacterium]
MAENHQDEDFTGHHAASLGTAKVRLAMVAAAFLLGYFAITLRLADLTLLSTPSSPQLAQAQDVRPLAKPLRASLLDRNGEIMAASLAMASLYADAGQIQDAKATAQELAAILSDVSVKELETKLSSGKHFIWLARNITPKQEYAINALGNPALGFQQEERRIYPSERLAAHLTGYTDVDGRGIAGAEKFFEKQLAAGKEPVQLSVDLRVQHILHRELAASMKTFSAKAATGVVMDVNSGEIIAAVSLPDFDPLKPKEASDDEKFNRLTLGVYEMGSTMKLFSTAAALDSGKVGMGAVFDASEPIKYGRFTINDYHAKKRAMTVPEIFIYSSNIGTARMAQALGDNGLKDFYKRLGFFEAVPIELPERGSPLYPKPWRDISTLTTSFGHGIAVTALHLVRATAALANGGTLVVPTLLKGKKSLSPEPEGERVVKPQTSAQIRQLLELVVASGTGSKAGVEGYNVGGKTGTAEKNTGGNYKHDLLLSSFIGVFPIESPRFAVLAMLDEPKPTKESYGYATGGWTAAPVVSRVVEQLAPLYRMAPEEDTRPAVLQAMGKYMKEGIGRASAGTDR